LVDEGGDEVWAVQQLGLSPKLRRRRFQLLPVRGPGAPFTEVQGRMPGGNTAPAELADLISSIAAVGVLQPVLVEELADPVAGSARMRLTNGERRLRAIRWGAAHEPRNPHFQHVPAVVCPGPLSDEERRVWQLVENLARQPLRPTELAMALLLHRCAVLVGNLLAAGKPVPAQVYALDDPVARFEALERLRGADSSCAAPWTVVLERLGLQLTPRDARQLIQAFREMPRDLAEEMDEAKVRLHTRLRFLGLMRGRSEAAQGIWAAVKARGRPELLPAALSVAEASDSEDDFDAEVAVDQAAEARDLSYAARGAKLRRPESDGPDAVDRDRPDPTPTARPREAHLGAGQVTAASVPVDDSAVGAVVDPALVAAVFLALRELVAALSRGKRLKAYDLASLQLLYDQIRSAPRAA